MKIVFISYLYNDISQGPVWSVPASVKAQSDIDDVLWIDLGDARMEHWQSVKAYHKISDYEKLSLDVLPEEFRDPDLVVFEGFYRMEYVRFSRQLRKRGVPYIIVPRCSLTSQAHSTKSLKKTLADIFFFKKFAKKALCIQYLSEDERNTSSKTWNSQSIVIPNGIDMPSVSKTVFSKTGVNAIFIGRLNAFHKGLDVLLEACHKARRELEQSHFHLMIYGEKRRDYETLNKYVHEHDLEHIVSFGGLIVGEEKVKAILNADIHIMTSRFEGLPMAMIETLAYGIPALVTPGTNMQEEIVMNDAGWGCDCDANSICEALMAVVKELSLLKKKGENARELAKKFSWVDAARNFHDEINNLISVNK